MNKDAINQRIQALESELAGLKAELSKPKKFEFKYANGTSFSILAHEVLTERTGLDCDFQNNFRYRQTEANAQEDFQLQKELMCIGALAEQIDPNYKSKIIWDTTTCNYQIYFNNKIKRYELTYTNVMQSLGVVYMPKDVAEKVCKILNDKQVNLK